MKFTKIDDAFDLCGVKKEFIIHFIEEDWIHPADLENDALDEEDLARIRLIRELKDDFGVNDEGLLIILNLVDQLNRMHLEIGKLNFENNKFGRSQWSCLINSSWRISNIRHSFFVTYLTVSIILIFGHNLIFNLI